MLSQIANWLQDKSVITVLTSTGWSAALFAILRYFGMFVLVRSMAIVDLPVLGVTGRDKSATILAEGISPWAWISLAVNIVSA